jgi:hypothetical protein
VIVWTTSMYDRLEAAIRDGRRICIYRNGTEFVVIAHALRVLGGRETIITRHPTTGDHAQFRLDEIERFEVVQ